MSARVLALDFETTIEDPFDAKKAQIIEFAAILWDTERNRALECVSGLVKPINYKHHPMSESLCGIYPEMIEKSRYGTIGALGDISAMAEKADYFCAHNAHAFDKIVMECEIERTGFPQMPKLPWIDTTLDLPFPKDIETRKLEFLAVKHGFMNFFAHQAAADVMTMLTILSKYDFKDVVRISKAKSFIVKADIPPPWTDGGKGTEAAKSRGYRFKADTKNWIKEIKEFDLEKEKTEAPFKILVGKEVVR